MSFDALEGICLTKSNTKDSRQSPPPATMVVSRYAFEYNMNHRKRGLALIFCHKSFDKEGCKTRIGAEKDVANLEGAFKRLDFEVAVHRDCKGEQIHDITKKAAKSDHSEHDCLVIAISTHGECGGYVEARNGSYNLDTIFEYFTADKCPTLAGKPKLFIIQACRGKDYEDGIRLETKVETDGQGLYSSYRIPLHADFLIAYSTIPGYVAWHNPVCGSYFIDVLANVLNEYAEYYDILTLLTLVNQRIAIDFESVSDKATKCNRKQMPSFTSMLTRMLKFNKKTLTLYPPGNGTSSKPVA